MTEKASCYNECLYGHDCFGGYLSGEVECDREIERIKLEKNAEFYPTPEGLIFWVDDNSQNKIMLENGEVVEI